MSTDIAKRNFIKNSLVGLTALSATGLPLITRSAPSNVINWKMVTSWPRNFPGLGTGAERLAQRIYEATDGRLIIKVYGDGEIVPAMEVFDTVSKGTVQMGHSTPFYWKGKISAAPFFTSIPFGLTTDERFSWLFYGGGLELWRELYAPFNLVPFPIGSTGLQWGGWFNKKIQSVKDIAGLRVRFPGIGGEVMTKAGAIGVTLPGSEIFSALKSGTIDGAEWVGPFNDLAFGLHRAARYYYYPGWHETSTVGELMVNKTAFDSLPKDIQSILRMVTQAACVDMTTEFLYENALGLKKIKAMPDIEILPFPDDVLSIFKKHTVSILEEISHQSSINKRIYDSFRSFQELMLGYSKKSMLPFLIARDKG